MPYIRAPAPVAHVIRTRPELRIRSGNCHSTRVHRVRTRWSIHSGTYHSINDDSQYFLEDGLARTLYPHLGLGGCFGIMPGLKDNILSFFKRALYHIIPRTAGSTTPTASAATAPASAVAVPPAASRGTLRAVDPRQAGAGSSTASVAVLAKPGQMAEAPRPPSIASSTSRTSRWTWRPATARRRPHRMRRLQVRN